MLNFATIVTQDFLAVIFVNAVVYLILIFFELCGKAKHQPNRPSVCFVAKGLACHACFMHGRAYCLDVRMPAPAPSAASVPPATLAAKPALHAIATPARPPRMPHATAKPAHLPLQVGASSHVVVSMMSMQVGTTHARFACHARGDHYARMDYLRMRPLTAPANVAT